MTVYARLSFHYEKCSKIRNASCRLIRPRQKADRQTAQTQIKTGSEEAYWSGSTLFANLTSIFWIPTLVINIQCLPWLQHFSQMEKKLEPNEINFSQGFRQKVVSTSCFVFISLPARGDLLLTDNLCKQFGPRAGPTKCRAWSGSKLFDTWIVLEKSRIQRVKMAHWVWRNIRICKSWSKCTVLQICIYFWTT